MGKIPDIIDDNERGLLVPSGDAHWPAAAIEEGIMGTITQSMTDKARDYVAHHYSEKNMLARYENLYRHQLHGPSPDWPIL